MKWILFYLLGLLRITTQKGSCPDGGSIPEGIVHTENARTAMIEDAFNIHRILNIANAKITRASFLNREKHDGVTVIRPYNPSKLRKGKIKLPARLTVLAKYSAAVVHDASTDSPIRCLSGKQFGGFYFDDYSASFF